MLHSKGVKLIHECKGCELSKCKKTIGDELELGPKQLQINKGRKDKGDCRITTIGDEFSCYVT